MPLICQRLRHASSRGPLSRIIAFLGKTTKRMCECVSVAYPLSRTSLSKICEANARSPKGLLRCKKPQANARAPLRKAAVRCIKPQARCNKPQAHCNKPQARSAESPGWLPLQGGALSLFLSLPLFLPLSLTLSLPPSLPPFRAAGQPGPDLKRVCERAETGRRVQLQTRLQCRAGCDYKQQYAAISRPCCPMAYCSNMPQ